MPSWAARLALVAGVLLVLIAVALTWLAWPLNLFWMLAGGSDWNTWNILALISAMAGLVLIVWAVVVIRMGRSPS